MTEEWVGYQGFAEAASISSTPASTGLREDTIRPHKELEMYTWDCEELTPTYHHMNGWMPQHPRKCGKGRPGAKGRE